MKHVLVLLTTNFPDPGGDSAFLNNEINALADAFDQVVVFSYLPPSEPILDLPPNVYYGGALGTIKNVSSRTLLLSGGRARKALRSSWLESTSAGRTQGPNRIRKLIRRGMRFAHAIDTRLEALGVTARDQVTVYAFWATHAAIAVPFLAHADRVVMRMHRFDLYEHQTPLLPLRASLFDASDVVVPISTDGKNYLLEHYPQGILSPEKVRVSRLGTHDPGVYRERDDRLGWPKAGTLRVVSCSSVIPVKNVSAIVPAVEELALLGPVEWTHLGGGELEGELNSLAQSAMERQPNLTISLLGQVTHSDVLEHLGTEKPDVFINVSDSEGVPVSIMEALSFGIPVVATDVGGSGEIVAPHLGSGILVPKRPTPEILVSAIREVVGKPEDFDPRATWESMSNAAVKAREIVGILKGEESTPGTTTP